MLNKNAQDMSTTDVKNKFKTLTEGKLSDAVLDKMVTTFQALIKNADFKTSKPTHEEKPKKEEPEVERREGFEKLGKLKVKSGVADLVYNIQIHLPESTNSAVYEAIFRALKEHLL